MILIEEIIRMSIKTLLFLKQFKQKETWKFLFKIKNFNTNQTTQRKLNVFLL
jgi:hypothetical protein